MCRLLIISDNVRVLRILPDACYRSGLSERIIAVSDFTRTDDLDLQVFRKSLAKPQPPVGLNPALQALWWDGKGDWNKAHERAQEHENRAACMCMPISIARKVINRTRNTGIAGAVSHHRSLTVDEEWEELARALLEQG